MLPRLYGALTMAATPFVRLYLGARRRRGKEDAARFRERFGVASLPRPAGPLLWFHAASVGEAMSVRGLIVRLLVERPGLAVLITTGTVTAARLLDATLPPRARHQYAPVDLPGAVARFLDHWRPDLAVWVESELWPNLVLATHRRGIPMLLLNARLSARSQARWQAWPGLIQPILSAFALCLAQDEAQAGRLRELGAPLVASVGDLKSAAEKLPADPVALGDLERWIDGRPCWLAACTHSGEDEAAADAHLRLKDAHDRLLTIIAPRHPARGAALAAMLGARGLVVARRSAGESITATVDIYLADTLGEMGLFYRLVDIAFIGGSLSGRGGHNPFEAARLGCAVLHGPDMRNCAAMAETLSAAGGSQTVSHAESLAAAVGVLLVDPQRREAMAVAAARAAAAGDGVLTAVLQRLTPWLDPLAPRIADPAIGSRRARQSSPRYKPMRAPEFWDRRPGLYSGLLSPAAAGWIAAARVRRAFATPFRAPVPVICVGNLVAGGSGKTPVVLSLVDIFAERGIEVHVVTRGYGGALPGPVRVDAAGHDPGDVGDEALLIAAKAPCWVARDRAAGLRAAASAGSELIVLDDGFQNPGIAKDMSLVVVDAAYGFGNRRVIPAGPLREPVEAGLARADAIVLIGDGDGPAAMRSASLPILRADLVPLDGEHLAGRHVIAFAGIGRPGKFFTTLENLGANLVATHPFPDHHPFRLVEIEALRRRADEAGALLVTTAKDWVRLPRHWRAGIDRLNVELRWRHPAAIQRLFETKLDSAFSPTASNGTGVGA